MKNKIGIGVWDLHYSYHIKPLWKNILKAIKGIKPDYFIFGGDNLNFTAVSHWLHEKGKNKTLEGKRLIKEYKGFNKEIMEPLLKVLPKKCKKIWLMGNHEMWVELAIEKNPQGEGFWEIENNIDLSDWKIIPYPDYYRIGKAYFIHGTYTNDHHAKKTVTTYEHSVFYGHCHTKQVYSKVTPVGNEAHIGVAVPCACELNPDYRRHHPNAWINGFLKFEILKNGCFTDELVTANSKGQFVLSGKNYD